MTIIEKLLDTMDNDAPVERLVVGAHLTMAVAGGRAGLSTTLRPRREAHGKLTVTDPGGYEGGPVSELARLALSKLPMEASIGMAALNAALPSEGLNFRDANGFDLLAEKARGKRVAMVGHFPFAKKLGSVAAELNVIELDPRGDDLPAEKASEVLPRSDIVVITGSAFANHTFEGLIELARSKWVMALGPTTPLSPVLLSGGADAVAGSVVADIGLALRQISQGAVFKQLEGVRRVLLLSG